MAQEHADQLKTVYSHLYPGKEYAPLSLIYQQSATACVYQQAYGSLKAKTDRCSVIIANWPTSLLYQECKIRIGIIFLHKAFVLVSGGRREEKHIFAHVNWLKQHVHSEWYGKAAVCENVHDDATFCYVPIQRILSPCAHAHFTVDFSDIHNDKVFVAIPVHATHLIS